MIPWEIDPQTTITCPRPMPDEVVVVVCDENGAQAQIVAPKESFDAGITGLVAALDEGIAKLYATPGKSPSPVWALDPATLAARDERRAKYLADPANIRPGDRVMYRDPRQQPGVPRSDDIM
jgi:hypothetical protein